MIAVDTNVLLRYLLQDDEAQSAKADELMNSHQSVFISDVVLVEMIWTLTGKRYRLGADEIARVIRALFEEPAVAFQDQATVWRALSDFQAAVAAANARAAGFADYLALHAAKSRVAADGERLAGFFTFDAAAQRLPGARAP